MEQRVKFIVFYRELPKQIEELPTYDTNFMITKDGIKPHANGNSPRITLSYVTNPLSAKKDRKAITDLLEKLKTTNMIVDFQAV